MTTFKDWDDHFATLTEDRKLELYIALATLSTDPMFKRYFGEQFALMPSLDIARWIALQED